LNGQHSICNTLHNTKFYPGGFAQYLKVPEINIDRGSFILPDDMTFDHGTFIEPLACVVRGFRIAGFKPAQSVLVLGSGMAGLLNIKLAKAYGASKIFATDIDESRIKSAKRMGADISVSAKENVPELIREENDGRLADFVILCVGVSSAVKQAIESVEPGGTILWFAPTMPGEQVPFPMFDVWNKQIKMFSTYAGAGKDIIDAIELISSKQVLVDDMITHKLPMDKASDGFKLVANASDSIKVIIEPNR
jgi:L-iditol 2-dehydrogenase